MSRTKGLQVENKMAAAMALMELSWEPPNVANQLPNQTENRQCQTDLTYEIPHPPSTSFSVSLDMNVKVTAGNSKQQRSEVAPNSPEIAERPSGDLNIQNNKNNCQKQSRQKKPPAAAQKGKRRKNKKVKGKNSSVENKMGTRRIKHDVGTQTDYYDDPVQRIMERINMLRARKQDLEAELKSLQERTPESSELSSSERDSNPPSVESASSGEYFCPHRARKPKADSDSGDTGSSEDSDVDNDNPEDEIEDIENHEEDAEHDEDTENNDSEEDLASAIKRGVYGAMTPIGNGDAKVPSSLLRTMDWSSYGHVTRKLLTAVFPRKILATHSLSGKPSPAFPGRKAKAQLDPYLVNDIVQTVTEHCGISERLVRASITTKCADECKLLRNRQRNRQEKSLLAKKENIDPQNLPPRQQNLPPLQQNLPLRKRSFPRLQHSLPLHQQSLPLNLSMK